jgi:hypothetical protein
MFLLEYVGTKIAHVNSLKNPCASIYTFGPKRIDRMIIRPHPVLVSVGLDVPEPERLYAVWSLNAF